MGTVLIREFKALIGNIYAIATAAVFSVASGILFIYNNLTLTYPSIDAVVATMSIVSAILIPVIACFSINGERKRGTDELLSVLPLTRAQIVLGKFFGILAFLMIPTGVIFIYPVIAGFFGDPAYLYSYITLLVFVAFEAFIVAFSLMLSSIFKKGWMSIAVAYGVLLVFFLLGSFSVLMPEVLGDICRAISPFRQFDAIVFGVLDLSSIAYFILLTLVLLLVTVRLSFGKKSKRAKKWTVKAAAVAAVSAVAIAALSVLPATVRWIDVSEDKIYSTSDTTKGLIDSLDEDVTVYLIDPDGSEPKLVNAIERYCDASKHISFETVDTTKDTKFREDHGLSADATLSFCLVVESAKRWKFVSADALFVWYNSQTGYMSTADYSNTISSLQTMIDQYSPYYSSMSSAQQQQLQEYIALCETLLYDSTQCLDVENVLSSAIEYVTAEVIPTFYFLTGHGEKNTQGGPLDIRGLSKIPEEAAMLVLNTPDEDYSDAETDMLIDFMNNGGRLIVFTGKQNNSMPNLSRLLASAGLSLEPDAIEDEKVTATVNTSSDALSLLASTEKVTLDIMKGDSILTDESDKSLKFTSLYTLDIEEKTEILDQNGEMQTTTKVVTKNLGVAVTKNSEPMLVWITGSDTFNRTQSELDEEELKQYSVAMY
ncbi:MAG: Gldg family protein, partial [Clostridia bacterium]|nr:Gldg family protein [Clostridia bacterium]